LAEKKKSGGKKKRREKIGGVNKKNEARLKIVRERFQKGHEK